MGESISDIQLNTANRLLNYLYELKSEPAVRFKKGSIYTALEAFVESRSVDDLCVVWDENTVDAQGLRLLIGSLKDESNAPPGRILEYLVLQVEELLHENADGEVARTRISENTEPSVWRRGEGGVSRWPKYMSEFDQRVDCVTAMVLIILALKHIEAFFHLTSRIDGRVPEEPTGTIFQSGNTLFVRDSCGEHAVHLHEIRLSAADFRHLRELMTDTLHLWKVYFAGLFLYLPDIPSEAHDRGITADQMSKKREKLCTAFEAIVEIIDRTLPGKLAVPDRYRVWSPCSQ